MNYLIDGHNVIAQTPGLSLADPDDEAKLVHLLRRWTAADARRQVTVIFDGGLPAGEAKHLSGGGVKAVFAPNNSTADAVLIRRIEAVGNPPEFVVVSSDGVVRAAAARRRIAVQRSEEFAVAMMTDRQFKKDDKTKPQRPDAPTMNADEMQEWLSLFGPEPETPRPARPVRKPPPKPSAPQPKTEEQKAADDIDDWLRLFGYKE
ncbi:MAG: NYN domain-containing protein [Candidatus Promineofilum sp.]|nr:NYN domain-containing protein [Promineifilum sp.]